MREALGTTFGILIAILVVVGLCIGGYFAYWAIYGDSTNRQGHVDQQKYSRQVGLVSGINEHANDVSAIDVQLTTASPDQVPVLKAQRKAIVESICTDGANLNDTAQMSRAAQALYATC